MKVLVAPDKFKGCLSSKEASSLIAKSFRLAGYETVTAPIADGGEGTVDAIVTATGGIKQKVDAEDPLGRRVESFIGLIEDDSKAIIEMAAASGLHLLKEEEQNPLNTSTFGTGELIKAALDKCVSEIVIGIGGSATNDAGMGAAKALGAKFFDVDGNELEANGADLNEVANIDLKNIDERIYKTKIEVAVDVKNPFYGKEGAAYVYGPQKGANKDQVEFLDKGLRSLSNVINEQIGIDLQVLKGSGAAGGLGGGLVAFLGAKIVGGTEYICKIISLEEKVAEADLVITGEGRVDEQTLYGKAPSGVIKLAKKYGKQIAIISGHLGEGWQKIENAGAKVFPLTITKNEIEECIGNPKPAIEKAVLKIINDLKSD